MILVVVGTRPELLKMAPVCKLARERGLPIHVHCTMQSPDLVDRGILAWDSQGPWDNADDVAGLGMAPRCVVVQGDTRTAYRAAVNAFEHGFPVFHLEAGVRTGRNDSPYPEEGYRRVISALATYHACTTNHNAQNLVAEGHRRGDNLRTTGSPIVESVRERVAGVERITDYENGPKILVTLHRRENRGKFRWVWHGIRQALGPKANIIWPAHPNGWAAAEAPNWATPLPPMAGDDFAAALLNADLLITDSGGANEESSILGVPCCLFREVSDRPECLVHPEVPGGNTVIGWGSVLGVRRAIHQAMAIDRATIDTEIYGDGLASERIAEWWGKILAGGHDA